MVKIAFAPQLYYTYIHGSFIFTQGQQHTGTNHLLHGHHKLFPSAAAAHQPAQHHSIQCPFIITGYPSRAIQVEPALLTLSDAQDCVMNITACVVSNMPDSQPHLTVQKDRDVSSFYTFTVRKRRTLWSEHKQLYICTMLMLFIKVAVCSLEGFRVSRLPLKVTNCQEDNLTCFQDHVDNRKYSIHMNILCVILHESWG